MSKSPLESTWLYHEIGRCHLELGNYEKAKEYGEKSLASAQEADDPVWQLNATVLIAQAEGMWWDSSFESLGWCVVGLPRSWKSQGISGILKFSGISGKVMEF